MKYGKSMNIKYHISEPDIKCPYCDKHYADDDFEVVYYYNVQLECGHCEKHFWASARTSYDTNTDCSLNSIEHDWYNSESHPTLFHCHNCSQYKVEA
jgi:hypothetical protein